MVLPHFSYLIPESLEDASRMLLKYGPTAKIMAGATDLIIPMKDHAIRPEPEYLIDIKNLDDLRTLTYSDEDGLTIGCLTTLRTLEFSPLVREHYSAVAVAAKSIASTQIRAKGTMVGNICNASPSCDSGPILLAGNASIHVFNCEHGTRDIPAEEFFKGVKKTSLEPGDIVTGITFPALSKNQHAVYLKHAVRKAMDLAIVGIAAVLTVEDGICMDARLAAGAVAITPVRLPDAEKVLIGHHLTDDIIDAAARCAKEACHPISDIRASKEYRSAMVEVFTRRAIRQALSETEV